MNSINPTQSIIVFDLDDTLYSEFAYKVSGIRSVIRCITALYPEWTTAELEALVDTKKSDWLDTLCQYCKLNDSEKQTLLWHYRLHSPAIQAYLPTAAFADLIKDFAAVALISDGRSLTQRLKLKALGIADYFDDILISEAYGSEKPNEQRFRIIQEKYQEKGNQFIYIGDNIKKDFITPKRMGWLTIGLTTHADSIHVHHPYDFEPEYHPHIWLQSLNQLSDIIIR